MSAYILYNDAFFLADDPIIAAGNRGFRFGDGLFESMRMAQGKLLFPEHHADRLSTGMKVLKMEGYNLIDVYFLKQKTAELQKKNKFAGNVRFRLTIYREGLGLYTPEINKIGYLLEATPLDSAEFQLNKKGLIIDLYDEIPKPINKFSNFKTTNALLYVMAGLFQKQHRIDEAFLLNQSGYLCESTSSNVFIVYQGAIYTPALSEGCVSGVMRNVVLQLCKMNEIPVIEAQINPEILKQAEEVFVTNATSGIRWVMGFDRKRYFNEFSKKIVLLLNQHISVLN